MTAQTITLPSPIFYETLAVAAQCSPADAYEHFHANQNANPRGRMHPVETFLEDFAPVKVEA